MAMSNGGLPFAIPGMTAGQPAGTGTRGDGDAKPDNNVPTSDQIAQLGNKLDQLPENLREQLGTALLRMEQEREASANRAREAEAARAREAATNTSRSDRISKFDELSPDDKVGLLREIIGSELIGFLKPELEKIGNMNADLTTRYETDRMTARLREISNDPKYPFFNDMRNEMRNLLQSYPGADPVDLYGMAMARHPDKVAGLQKARADEEAKKKLSLEGRFGGMSQEIRTAAARKDLSPMDAALVAWDAAFPSS